MLKHLGLGRVYDLFFMLLYCEEVSDLLSLPDCKRLALLIQNDPTSWWYFCSEKIKRLFCDMLTQVT